MPFDCGSTRPMTALVATAASIALPPRSSTCTPARAASGWLAATMPYRVAMRDRPAITLIRRSYTTPVTLPQRPRRLNAEPAKPAETRPDFLVFVSFVFSWFTVQRETWPSLSSNPGADKRAGPDPARHRAADHRSPWPGLRGARARGARRPSARVSDLGTRRDLSLVRHRRVGGGAREYPVARRQRADVRDRPLRRALARHGRAARSAGRLHSRRLAPRRRSRHRRTEAR